MGDGNGLRISHTGIDTLHSHYRPLLLQHTLYVPEIKKNLISVARLVTDCNVLIEFVNDVCLIKDKVTGMVLLQGELKSGLYQVSSPAVHLAFLSSKSDSSA